MARHRRAVEWFDVDMSFSVASAGQESRALTVSMLDSQKKGATIVRTVLDLWLISTVLNARVEIVFGVVLINDDAFASSALPDPSDPSDQPGWMWRQKVIIAGDASNTDETVHVHVDSPAKRKFPGEEHQQLLIIDSQTGAFDVECWGRVLVMKP